MINEVNVVKKIFVILSLILVIFTGCGVGSSESNAVLSQNEVINR